MIRAEGKDRLERVITAQVDKNLEPIPGTEKEFKVDTLLVAVGLSPVNEIFKQAKEFGFNAYTAGDSETIAEASAAIFSGKITGRKILIDMGCNITIPHTWYDTAEILKSRPGETFQLSNLIHVPDDTKFYPIIRCNQEIPCNPCVDSCPNKSISLKGRSIIDVPVFNGKCTGCGRCVAICPGLAITLVNKKYDPNKEKALVVIPWEMPDKYLKEGDIKLTTGFEGEVIGAGKVIRIHSAKWMNKRKLLHLEVPYGEAELVAGIQIQNINQGDIPDNVKEVLNEDIYICRCERVTRKQIIDKIKEGYMDFNALKAELRVGMGACGGKTCMQQIWKIYRECGVAVEDIKQHAHRPFEQEVPMEAFLK
jgi:sarcosine oxidase, subunit alpha